MYLVSGFYQQMEGFGESEPMVCSDMKGVRDHMESVIERSEGGSYLDGFNVCALEVGKAPVTVETWYARDTPFTSMDMLDLVKA